MENKKTSRYLKYAIGEIILVVIGILIALQINNWNQNSQVKRTNQLFLKKMLIDLENIESRLNSIVYTYDTDNDFNYQSLTKAINACDTILKLTQSGLKEEHLEYLAQLRPIQGNTLINIYDNTYKELLNTGRLYNLGSDELIKAIQNFYKFCERETRYQEFNIDDINRGAVKFEDGFNFLFMKYNQDPRNFPLTDYPFYFNPKSIEYKNFELGISVIKNCQNNNKGKMIQIVDEAKKLSHIINESLASYD